MFCQYLTCRKKSNGEQTLTKKKKHATDKSKRITSKDKPKKASVHRKKPTQTSIRPFSNVIHDDVASACKVTGFCPWKSVVPFLRYLRRKRFNVNVVLNEALLYYLGVCVWVGLGLNFNPQTQTHINK